MAAIVQDALLIGQDRKVEWLGAKVGSVCYGWRCPALTGPFGIMAFHFCLFVYGTLVIPLWECRQGLLRPMDGSMQTLCCMDPMVDWSLFADSAHFGGFFDAALVVVS